MNKNQRYIAIGAGIVLLIGAVVYYQFRQKQLPKPSFAPDSTVYSKQDYSSLVLDSTVLASFFASRSLADSVQADVRSFYQRRGYQYAWFSENRLTHAADNFNNLRQSYINDFADSSLYNAEIDRLVHEAITQDKQFLKNKTELQKLELLLTTAFFQYADKAYTGTVKDLLDLEWFIPRKKKNFQALLDTLVMVKGQPIREPVNRYYTLLKEKLRQYRIIQQKGGWPSLTFQGKAPKKGEEDSTDWV